VDYAAEKQVALDAELAIRCGRTTAAGTPCGHRPIYWPGRGRVAGCNRHMTADEERALYEVWLDIKTHYACPGCTAGVGDPCREERHEIRLVNGDWAKIRSFAGIRMHDARLELFEDQAERITPINGD